MEPYFLDPSLWPVFLAVWIVTHWLVAPRVHAWNRAARWEPLPWYVPPKPGSLRYWFERPRPRLHAVGAWVVSAIFLCALIELIFTIIAVILVS